MRDIGDAIDEFHHSEEAAQRCLEERSALIQPGIA
jgi:hypothetical protein